MRELALNILDIVENSVKANAKNVRIDILKNDNNLEIVIGDDGKGMDEDFLKKVTDPFTTTRTTRNVGLGIPLFKMISQMSGGTFEIQSKVNVGTTIKATFLVDSIDRPPLGDIAESMVTLLDDEIDTEFFLNFSVDNINYEFNTKELKIALDGMSVQEPSIILYVKEMIKENIKQIGGESL